MNKIKFHPGMELENGNTYDLEDQTLNIKYCKIIHIDEYNILIRPSLIGLIKYYLFGE